MSSPSHLGATAVHQRPTPPSTSAAAPANSLPNRPPHRRTASDALYPRPASPNGHHPLSSSAPKSNYHGPPTTTLSRLLAFFPTVASTRWRRRRVVIFVALFLAFLCLLTLPESSSNAASTMYRQQQQLLSNRRRLRPVDGGKRGAMVDPRWLRKQGDGIRANLPPKGMIDRRNNHKTPEGTTAKEVNTVRPRHYVKPQQAKTPRDTPDASQATLESEDDDYSLNLTVPEELAALILFLASSSDNHLSVRTDPQAPLDPDAVLDVSLPTRPDEANQRADVLEQLQHDCWELWPTVVIGRRGQPATEKVKKLLRKEHYFGKKGTGLAYIETRGRPDEDVLVALLTRLTGLKTLPMILIGGHPVGSFAELNDLHEAGDLGAELVEAGGGETIGHERRVRLEFEGLTEEEAQEEEREEAAAEAEKRDKEKENA